MKRIIETTFDLRRRAPILRRGFLQKAAGAGFVLSSGLSTPVRADEDHEDNDKTVHCAVPLPQPHTTAGPFGPLHFYFPGPIDGSAAATDGTGTHPEGRDPSTITNFSGFVGAADLLFSGTATDTNSGAKATYQFHTDTRFMQGEFIASDEQRHRGAFAFIWIDSITASPLGPHSYDPGTSPALVLWTVKIPDESVEVDLDSGEASLELHNVCSVFDAFTVPNSLNSLHPLGLVSGAVKSLRIHWKGINNKRSFNNGATFRGNFIETSATIKVTVDTPSTNPPFTPAPQDGFEFVADPTTTVTNFAQIGHENNGSLF